MPTRSIKQRRKSTSRDSNPQSLGNEVWASSAPVTDSPWKSSSIYWLHIDKKLGKTFGKNWMKCLNQGALDHEPIWWPLALHQGPSCCSLTFSGHRGQQPAARNRADSTSLRGPVPERDLRQSSHPGKVCVSCCVGNAVQASTPWTC